jgi:hypothetical protein
MSYDVSSVAALFRSTVKRRRVDSIEGPRFKSCFPVCLCVSLSSLP